jgi:drug/metabolite transporter (DMT)-like permease
MRPIEKMSPFIIFSTIICVIGISVGQILFKRAALLIPTSPSWHDWVFNGWLIAAVILYGMTTLGWVWILRNAQLHMAYPFMGLAFLIVPLLAWMLLGEPLHWRTLAGGFLILSGVALASAS